uniref:Predicted protein n=1 Tax=Hordeum vulgare subsp. vulgare TaxID=112509 RepID=F2CYI1_HORVV|nr:predicted protein [Hordeum vulgare subsp. vulgare]
MWQQMTMNSGVTMQSGPYHVRPGEPDCTYYLRTGLCSFGMSCTFNHPQDRNTVSRLPLPAVVFILLCFTCSQSSRLRFPHFPIYSILM